MKTQEGIKVKVLSEIVDEDDGKTYCECVPTEFEGFARWIDKSKLKGC